jgi:YebC/PmpR family DNA-binding regulatory protein
MAGHNKWSKIKRLKAVLDSKRGKVFSRYAKEIAVAVRLGGCDASTNPRLRSAVQASRAANMPNDNIDRAIRKGTGEGASGNAVEELVYEGYAPGGVALLIEASTDNKNRTAPDLRLVLGDHGGNLASSGSTSYLFQRVGHIELQAPLTEEDHLLEVLLEADAGDCTHQDGVFYITTPPDKLFAVLDALRSAGFNAPSGTLTYEPQTTITVDASTAKQVEELCDALEELDDVLQVHSNHEQSGES